MSVVSYLLEHKVTVLKIVLALAVISGAAIFTRVGNSIPSSENPQILGDEAQTSVTSTPTPSADLITETKKNLTAFLDAPISKAKDLTNNVLGETTRLLQSTASKSAETVTQTIIQTTVEAIVKQIDKLPEKERVEVKQYICK
ncbi:MAG: hypothetical protein HYW86_04895 [Candidatus Roizmanbacteria bacterium]|nr:MAG: hypothetical protein HYW86_04895 [Candidatus Roizmanbacteria bacterium]